MLPDSLKNEEGLWYLCLFLLPPAILCLHSMVLSAHTHIDTQTDAHRHTDPQKYTYKHVTHTETHTDTDSHTDKRTC